MYREGKATGVETETKDMSFPEMALASLRKFVPIMSPEDS